MADSEEVTKLCNNCKKQIAANNFVMHEMHCKRHLSLCEYCQEPIPKNEMEVHFEETHAKIKCPKCAVEVEKRHLEDHEENDCAKKPMSCVYCELEVAKDALESHLDYCGSRTESCPKCSQFVMLKDLTRHTDSGCSYPEVKPQNTNTANGYSRIGENVFDSVYSQLGIQARGQNFPFFEEEMFGGLRPRGQGFQITPDVMYGRDIPPKRTADKRPMAKTSNEKTGLNKETEMSEYDKMLAMQLAQDLHRADSLEEIAQFLEKPKSPSPNEVEQRLDRNIFSANSVMIPCEFCGKQFDSDELVQHESGCSLDRISALLPQMTTSNNQREMGNASPTSVQPPSIVNNLRNYGADEWLDDTSLTGYDIATDMDRLPVTPATENESTNFLPCEFCFELFPMDSLIQHQAMCDRMTETPRPPTPPDERLRRPKKKTSMFNAERLAADFPNLSSKRHQPPPMLFNTHSDSDDDSSPSERLRSEGAHRVQKPKPSNVNGAFKSNVTTPAKETRSTLKKYGVETPDRGDYYARQSTYARQSSEEAKADGVSNLVQARALKRPTGSASRTRSTLNNLLVEADQPLSSGMPGVYASKRKENNPLGRPKVTAAASNSKVMARPRPTANARDVQHELSRYASSGSQVAQIALNKSSSNGPGFEVRVRPTVADEPSDTVTAPRQRPRANNVFGASSKPTTKRQTSNR